MSSAMMKMMFGGGVLADKAKGKAVKETPATNKAFLYSIIKLLCAIIQSSFMQCHNIGSLPAASQFVSHKVHVWRNMKVKHSVALA